MTLRQYLEGLWSVGLDDLEFRRRPQVLLELDEEKRKRLGRAESFLVEALAELSEASEILARYDLYRVGAEAPSAEVPLEVALAGCGLEAVGRFLDRPLREAVVWIGLVQVAESVKAQLMQTGDG